MTLENCWTISITDFKKKGCFDNYRTVAATNLTNNNGLFLSVEVEIVFDEYDKHLTLTHISKMVINKTESYKINIITIPSNLGNGVVMYLICPKTGKHCRKLFSCGGKFLHREAIGLPYEQQAKKTPISYAFYLNDKQRNEPNTKNFKKYYKGEMTKRYFRILLRTSNSEVIDAYKEIYYGQRLKKEKTQ